MYGREKIVYRDREPVMWDVANRIIICGGNGAGKSTLGKSLAKALDYQFMDIEDYYFPKTNENYPYAVSRTKEEVSRLLLEDMRRYEHFMLASVKGDYGREVESMFTCAILIHVPREIRIGRVRDRSFQKFGSRMLPGGDLYEKEKVFLEMVEKRPEAAAEDWLRSTSLPVIQVDGTKSVAYNTEYLSAMINSVLSG